MVAIALVCDVTINFIKARHRTAATSILNDLRLKDDEVSQEDVKNAQQLLLGKDATIEQLKSAAAMLNNTVSPPIFWSRIANDPSYPIYHRRICAGELLQRYVHAGMSLGEIAEILNAPTWLAKGDIHAILILGMSGSIPIQFGINNSGDFSITILPDKEKKDNDWLTMWIRVEGDVDEDQLYDLFLTPDSSREIGKKKLLEVAFTSGPMGNTNPAR